VNRHCGLSRRAKGATLGCAFFVALAVHDHRRTDHIRVIDPAIKYLNKDSAMPNRMPHFRESEKWLDQ